MVKYWRGFSTVYPNSSATIVVQFHLFPIAAGSIALPNHFTVSYRNRWTYFHIAPTQFRCKTLPRPSIQHVSSYEGGVTRLPFHIFTKQGSIEGISTSLYDTSCFPSCSSTLELVQWGPDTWVEPTTKNNLFGRIIDRPRRAIKWTSPG